MKETKHSTGTKECRPKRIKRVPATTTNESTGRGLYAIAASSIPEAKDGQKSATVWGAAWRVLVIVMLLVLCVIIQALCRIFCWLYF